EGRAVGIGLNLDTVGAGTRLGDWRRLQEANAVGLSLNVNTIEAGVRMADWRRLQEANDVKVKVKADPDLTSATRSGEEVGRTASAAAQASTQSGMSGMTALIVGGIAAAAPFVGAAIIGGVGAGFVGAAALVQRSNEQIRESFGQLGHDVVNTLRNASDQVVPQLAAAGHALDAEMQGLGPSIERAMSYAGPSIVALTGGVTSLAHNAMPGLVSAMQ